jgi:hypothetical protein
VRREQSASANGLGQDQRITGAKPAFTHDFVGVDQAVNGKAQCKFPAFTCVATDQRAACFVQNLNGAGHHLKDNILHLGFNTVRHGGDGCGALGFCAHGKHITQRVIGCNAAKGVRVINEGAEKVHGVNYRFAWRNFQNRRIVRRVQADDNVVALNRPEFPKSPG